VTKETYSFNASRKGDHGGFLCVLNLFRRGYPLEPVGYKTLMLVVCVKAFGSVFERKFTHSGVVFSQFGCRFAEFCIREPAGDVTYCINESQYQFQWKDQ